MDRIDWEIWKVEERHIIQQCVIEKLTEKKWLGYPTYSCTQEYVEELKPKVLKIVKYIYDRKLCHVSYLAYMSQNDLKEIFK